jgi:hypothetical protein
MTTAVVLMSALAFAGPPPGKTGPADWSGREGRHGGEKRDNRLHMMAVVGIAEALELNEAEALRMSDKLKGFEDKRRPVRQEMVESMRTLKLAADGDQAAGAQVDQAIQKVLDGRARLAALDREMFNALSQGLTPQKRARLALFMAKFGQQVQKLKAGGKGRHGPKKDFGQRDFGQREPGR